MTLRNLPAVEKLLQNAEKTIRAYSRPLVTHAIRESLEQVRADVRAGADVPSNEQLLALAQSRLASWTRSTLEPVITATLLHYLKDEAETEIPIWRMIAQTPELLKARAEHWQRETGCGFAGIHQILVENPTKIAHGLRGFAPILKKIRPIRQIRVPFSLSRRLNEI